MLKFIAWVGVLLKVVKGLFMVVRVELNKWVVRLLVELSLVLEGRAVSVLVVVNRVVSGMVVVNRVVSGMVEGLSLVLDGRYIWVLLK